MVDRSSIKTGSRPGPAAGPGRDPADADPARLARPALRARGPAARDLIRALGVDYAIRGDARPLGPNGAVDQPVQLAGGVRVGVDGEDAAGLGGQLQQPVRRVGALRPAVDLDGHALLPARGKDRLGVELRLRPPAPALAVGTDQPPGAVTEHGHVR